MTSFPLFLPIMHDVLLSVLSPCMLSWKRLSGTELNKKRDFIVKINVQWLKKRNLTTKTTKIKLLSKTLSSEIGWRWSAEPEGCTKELRWRSKSMTKLNWQREEGRIAQLIDGWHIRKDNSFEKDRPYLKYHPSYKNGLLVFWWF